MHRICDNKPAPRGLPTQHRQLPHQRHQEAVHAVEADLAEDQCVEDKDIMVAGMRIIENK